MRKLLFALLMLFCSMAWAQDVAPVMPDELPVFISRNGESVYQYVKDHVQYPKTAAAEGVTGIVQVSFVVTKKGKLADIQVRKSANPQLDAAALKVVKSMKKWKPAMKDGEPIDFTMALPVKFRLTK